MVACGCVCCVYFLGGIFCLFRKPNKYRCFPATHKSIREIELLPSKWAEALRTALAALIFGVQKLYILSSTIIFEPAFDESRLAADFLVNVALARERDMPASRFPLV